MSQPIPDDDAVAGFGETYQDAVYYPEAPQEQQEELAHEAAILAASYPIMGDVYEWFEEQIKACDSRRSINAYASQHGWNVEDTGRAFDIVRELLEAKSLDFEQFRKEK